MEISIRTLTLLLLVASTLAQFEGYHGYEHDIDAYSFKPALPPQSLDDHYHHEEDELDYHAHPKYAFDYSVKDPHTGDDKEHWETRDGDKVKGSYTLTETDGTKRVVEYEADDKNGFNAVVHKIGKPVEHVEHIKAVKYEPIQYHHEFSPQQFDEGFVPIAGYAHH
ncbi:cuticle protein 7-like [Leguminivora glycinivorella]|uniref:cuticle protein 7-like n=1 Tax=Leguminivora glycinivorella TaxID=1035111 RepID=UPI00200C8B45|nr:cuticle protein 7-like [Leguminivora glycinivorella]